jgi:hypothetical protein
LVIAIAHHQPATLLIELVGELLNVGGDLGRHAATSIC